MAIDTNWLIRDAFPEFVHIGSVVIGTLGVEKPGILGKLENQYGDQEPWEDLNIVRNDKEQKNECWIDIGYIVEIRPWHGQCTDQGRDEERYDLGMLPPELLPDEDNESCGDEKQLRPMPPRHSSVEVVVDEGVAVESSRDTGIPYKWIMKEKPIDDA